MWNYLTGAFIHFHFDLWFNLTYSVDYFWNINSKKKLSGSLIFTQVDQSFSRKSPYIWACPIYCVLQWGVKIPVNTSVNTPHEWRKLWWISDQSGYSRAHFVWAMSSSRGLSDSRVMDMAGWQHYPEHADTGGTKLVFKWEMRRGFKVGEIIIAKYILHLFKL